MPILPPVRAPARLVHGHQTSRQSWLHVRTLMDKVAEFDTAYPDEVPRPPHWGGFVVSPQEIEFWADGDFACMTGLAIH